MTVFNKIDKTILSKFIIYTNRKTATHTTNKLNIDVFLLISNLAYQIKIKHSIPNTKLETKAAATKPNLGSKLIFKTTLIMAPKILIPEFIFVFPLAVTTVPYNILTDEQ